MIIKSFECYEKQTKWRGRMGIIEGSKKNIISMKVTVGKCAVSFH